MEKYTDYRIMQEKKRSNYISIPRIIQRDVRNRHVVFPRDILQFIEKGAVILGVSKDSVSLS